MRIYFAAMQTHGIQSIDQLTNILLSYYDLVPSPIPFRKETFRLIKETYESKNKRVIRKTKHNKSRT
jgi:hypothetical protein